MCCLHLFWGLFTEMLVFIHFLFSCCELMCDRGANEQDPYCNLLEWPHSNNVFQGELSICCCLGV